MESEQVRKMWHPHLSRDWIDETNFKIIDSKRNFEENFPIFLEIKNKINDKKENNYNINNDNKFPSNNALLLNPSNKKMKCACKFEKEILSIESPYKNNNKGSNDKNREKEKINNKYKNNKNSKGENEDFEKRNMDNGKKFLRTENLKNNMKAEHKFNNISDRSYKGRSDFDELNKRLEKNSNNLQSNQIKLPDANKLNVQNTIGNVNRPLDLFADKKEKNLGEKRDNAVASNENQGIFIFLYLNLNN